MKILAPYLLFLGDVQDFLAAKTAHGIAHFSPEKCLGQLRLENCPISLELEDLDLEQAKNKGVKTLIIGVANRGGVISETWIPTIKRALELGFDIASGLHARLIDIPELVKAAEKSGARLIDVRHPENNFAVGNGLKRQGKRLLTVGTDCSSGKMFTSIALANALKRRGVSTSFKATGQTGIFITGEGVSIDAVVADFISGATEALSPEADEHHWDIIEGQGSLFHPSFAGVSMGLSHGSQPDALVMCHEPTRKNMRGLPHYPLPDLEHCIEENLKVARLTNPKVTCVGISYNTSNIPEPERQPFLEAEASRTGYPCIDPTLDTGPIIDNLIQKYKITV